MTVAETPLRTRIDSVISCDCGNVLEMVGEKLYTETRPDGSQHKFLYANRQCRCGVHYNMSVPA